MSYQPTNRPEIGKGCPVRQRQFPFIKGTVVEVYWACGKKWCAIVDWAPPTTPVNAERPDEWPANAKTSWRGPHDVSDLESIILDVLAGEA